MHLISRMIFRTDSTDFFNWLAASHMIDPSPLLTESGALIKFSDSSSHPATRML